MNKTKLMLAAVAVCVGVAACAKHDANAITGSNTSTGVSLSNDPSSYTIAEGVDNAVTFAPVATLVPQGVAIANGTQNMVYTFSNPDVAEINSDGNLQGDQVGTTTLTVTYTDVDHGFATTTLAIPVTVTAAP
ncbi:MAG: Ig-like domain-containing protein [Gemmatimonadaceae bacterium]